MMHYQQYGYNGGYGYGHGGGVVPVIVLVLLIVLVVMLARRRGLYRNMGMMNGTGSNHHSSALDIVKERYAKGEINKQEFEEKKKDLLS